MKTKYTFPNLKNFLKEKGVKLQEFYDTSYKACNGRKVGNRTWAHAMKDGHGVTETTINRMEGVANRIFAELNIQPDNDTLQKKIQ